MNLSLSNSLGSRITGALLPEAAAYIDAVSAVGATVTPTAKNAINSFIKAGKKNGWYNNIKRFYFPIWGAAAPNAIDLITLTSGTFNGVVTHANGYVQGNGSTGFFNFGVTFRAAGGTNNVSAFGGRIAQGSGTGFKTIVGTRANTFDITTLEVSGDGGSSALARITGFTPGFRATAGKTNGSIGFFIGNIGPTSLNIVRADSSGVEVFAGTGISGATNDTVNITAMRRNWSNPDQYDNGRLSMYGSGLEFTIAQSEDFVAKMKKLWESSTGLILP
jgi:hypothetical protein